MAGKKRKRINGSVYHKNCFVKCLRNALLLTPLPITTPYKQHNYYKAT